MVKLGMFKTVVVLFYSCPGEPGSLSSPLYLVKKALSREMNLSARQISCVGARRNKILASIRNSPFSPCSPASLGLMRRRYGSCPFFCLIESLLCSQPQKRVFLGVRQVGVCETGDCCVAWVLMVGRSSLTDFPLLGGHCP